MSLPRPTFICGTLSVSPEHPSDWTVKPLVQVSKNTTLNGTETRDLTWRKYEYELKWEMMSNTDHDNMEALFNYSIDNRLPINFTYTKFPQASTSVLCLGEMGGRNFKAGSGNLIYYSDVTIKLVERQSRI